MNITSGNLKILNTGTVFSFKNQSIKFDLDPQLQITVSFKDDVIDTKPRLSGIGHTADHAELILINFNDYGGRGYVEPVRIGNIGNNNIYFFFWATMIGSEKPTKKLEYTFYLEEPTDGN